MVDAKFAVFPRYHRARHVRIDLVQAHPVLGIAFAIEYHSSGDGGRYETVQKYPQDGESGEIEKKSNRRAQKTARPRFVCHA